ncbi:hypothetical protein GCM10023340_42360 [Nocardioides marinquilinus]|uniref:AB hydrolase-1 domain-containing protein n=1 Tax=Nocardioides marinquilinus TaxID=1210400 RepID=A0ABP9Q2G9_9ACTN
MDELSVVADDGVRLHVAACGSGPDVVVLSGGPGCVHYLADEALAPRGVRAWFPDPRGVGRSEGGAHPMARAVADLEAVRAAAGVERWVVLGHSWGGDLAVRYALDAPHAVRGVVSVAMHGLHRDRSWAEAYEAAKDDDPGPDIPFSDTVWRSLRASFAEWIHEPGLWRALADSPVPVYVVTAGDDIRPAWPHAQLAALVPRGSHEVVPGVPHDLWHTHPDRWVEVVTRACADLSQSSQSA